jgi:AraC family ethanolamine operon transcriptional activator
MDWTQVEPGAFAGNLSTLRLGSVRVFRDRFNVGSQRRGNLSPGDLFFGTLASTSTRSRWFGMPVTADDIAVGHRSIDARAIGSGAFFSIVIDRASLGDVFPNGEPCLIRNATHAATMRGFLRALFALTDAAPAMLRGASMRRDIERALLNLLRAAGTSRKVAPGTSFGNRFQAVRVCEAYMREHIDESVSLQDLSDLCGFRPRSLINAFEAFTGLSPMAYLKAQRLDGVRQTLLSTVRNDTRIIDIAMEWGFDHMGHFAADYRTMFGERPSETPRANPATVRGSVPAHARGRRHGDEATALRSREALEDLVLRFSERGERLPSGTIGRA